MPSCPRLHSTTLLQAGHSSLPQQPLQAEPFYFATKTLRRRNCSTLRRQKLESDAERYCGRDRCHSGSSYLGLCRLRGILSPPAPHDCAAGGPFFAAATKIGIGRGIVAATTFCRRAVLLAGTMALQAELIYFAAKKIRIGRGTLASTTFRRRAVLLAASMVLQRFLISGPDLAIAAALCLIPWTFVQ